MLRYKKKMHKVKGIKIKVKKKTNPNKVKD
jgi:hypothetical protein